MINMECGPDEYSYGMCIRLNKENMGKLGMKKIPSVGDKMTVHAMVQVKYVSESETDKSVELQITKMEIVNEDISTSKVLYGKTMEG